MVRQYRVGYEEKLIESGDDFFSVASLAVPPIEFGDENMIKKWWIGKIIK